MSDKQRYLGRRAQVYSWLDERGVDVAIFQQDADVRYLSGMVADSLLFMFKKGKALLLPWDFILAERLASVDEIIPYTEFGRKIVAATPAIVEREGLSSEGKIEIGASTSHPVFESLQEALSEREIMCRSDGIEAHIKKMRQIKDETEILQLRRSAEITNEILVELETLTEESALASEVEVALFLEKSIRELGGDGTGFDSIVAGPSRSFGIHAIPSYTSGPYATKGMSIVDFGVLLDGYTSDVSLTIIRGETDPLQERMIAAVQEAYERATETISLGSNIADVAKTVDGILGEHGFRMPHALGHGIGLDVHEDPGIRTAAKEEQFREGMVFTIEPGLYHGEAGGVRLENDILIGSAGAEILTKARLLRFP